MASVRPVYKMCVDKATGKRIKAFDAKGNPIQLKKWQIEVFMADGKRKTVTVPCTTQREAERQAARLQLIQDEVRAGSLLFPTASPTINDRPFAEVKEEYLSWGTAQGGRGGRPWGKGYARTSRIRLEYWEKLLKLRLMSDLENILPTVEKQCHKRLAEGIAGKTVHHEVNSLHALCRWGEKRKYLSGDPLENLGRFNTAPRVIRRLMTLDELDRLLKASPPHRSILYETAVCSGLRAEELRHLTPDHIDEERGGLILEAAWTKNRKDGFQHLPASLIRRLLEYSKRNDARTKYEAAFRQSGAPLHCPDKPLLYVPRATATTMDVDFRNAGIVKKTKAGKLDFHSLRVAFINYVLETVKDPKTAQAAARHETLDMTMNVYARTTDDRLRKAAESVGQLVLSATNPGAFPLPKDFLAGEKDATHGIAVGCVKEELVPGVGFEPTRPCGHGFLKPARMPIPPSRLFWTRNEELYNIQIHVCCQCLIADIVA